MRIEHFCEFCSLPLTCNLFIYSLWTVFHQRLGRGRDHTDVIRLTSFFFSAKWRFRKCPVRAGTQEVQGVFFFP